MFEDYAYLNGELLAKMAAGGYVTRFHPDHLGTPRLLTGPAAVKLAEHEYYPFGEEATAPQQSEPMKFTGHERDLLTTWQDPADDLDYMHARNFSPLTGRFLSFDPGSPRPASPQTWNRFAYVAGNPMKYIDADGEDLVIVYKNASSLTQRDRMLIERAVRKKFLNAGVKVVKTIPGETGKAQASKPTDRVVSVSFSDKGFFSANWDDPSRQYDGRYEGSESKSYEMEVSTARAMGLSDEQRVTMLANAVAHEVAHPLFRELGLYIADSFVDTAKAGSVMQSKVTPIQSAARPREFSDEDAELLRQLLNEPDGKR